MVTSEKIVEFIRSRDGLNVSKIEKEAKVPAKTIAKAMIADPIEIPSKHLEAIEAALAKYGYSDEQKKKNDMCKSKKSKQLLAQLSKNEIIYSLKLFYWYPRI